MKGLLYCSLLTTWALVVVSQRDDAWINGVATFYGDRADADPTDPALFDKKLPGGACGYGEISRKQYPFWSIAGINPSSMMYQRPMHGCGACIIVQCQERQVCRINNDTKASIILTVGESCKGDCDANQVNLSPLAFDRIAPVWVGRIQIRWQQVPCPASGNIIANVLQYRASGGGWIKLSFKKVAGDGGLTYVALAQAGTNPSDSSKWKAMSNTYGAVWEASSFGSPPLDIMLRDQTGQQVVLKNIITSTDASGDQVSDVQFGNVSRRRALQ